MRAELLQRFTHFFVDEFQDTDPLQAEILLLLAADDAKHSAWQHANPIPGKLFLVGDPKQSIYRFRRAEFAIYEDIKQRLVAAGAEVLHLSTSFRGRPSIQSIINAAFAPIMQAGSERIQAGYVPLQPWRQDVIDRPTVVALPIPRPYSDYGKVVNWRIEESFPDAVAAFVEWLTNESGWTVQENDELVPIRPRHICIYSRAAQLKAFSYQAFRSTLMREGPGILRNGLFA